MPAAEKNSRQIYLGGEEQEGRERSALPSRSAPVHLPTRMAKGLLYLLSLLSLIMWCAGFGLSAASLPRMSSRACTLASSAPPWHSGSRVALRAGNEDGGSTDAPAEEDGKEAVLRRLQALDAPKTAPKAATQTSKAGDLPDWAFFALPIAGMACAFASQFFLRQ